MKKDQKDLSYYRAQVKNLVWKTYMKATDEKPVTEDQVQLLVAVERPDGWKAIAYTDVDGLLRYYEITRSDALGETTVVQFLARHSRTIKD